MREIKFRAWDVKESKMVYPLISQLATINHKQFVIQKEAFGPVISIELMQYTGLKDKNDREIYEGDIVKNIGPHSPTIRKYGFREFRYINENLVVCKELVGTTLRHVMDFKFQLESPNGLNGIAPNGWYGPKPPVDNEQFWNYQRSFEVIGNVFENPELLVTE